MAHDVFLCYSSHDKAVADAMCTALENRKIRCWIAPRDVLPGVPYAEALIDAITQCRLFVLVYSAHANTSPQVIHEVERAVSKGIPVLPFRIENVPPSKSMEYFISATHWLDAMTPPLEQHLKRLADTVEILLTQEDALELPASGDQARTEAEGLRKAGPTQKPREPVATQQESDREPPFPPWRRRSTWKKRGTLFLTVVLCAGAFLGVVILLEAALRGAKTPTSVPTAIMVEERTVIPTSNTQGGTATSLIPTIKPTGFIGHTGAVNSVAFSPDGKYVLTGSDDATAKLWDAATCAEVRTFRGHTQVVMSVAFSPDGKYVLTGSSDATVKLWDGATGAYVRTFSTTTYKMPVVFSVAFSTDGKYVLTGGADGTANLWDAAAGTYVRTFSRHNNYVTSVAFSPDGKYVLTGSNDKTAKLWYAATGVYVGTFGGHTGAVTSVAFSPDGKYVLTGSDDWTARLWNPDTGANVRTFSGTVGAVTSVAYSPDGKYVLTGGADGTAKLWDAATGTYVRAFSGHKNIVFSVAFSPDGKHVLTGSADGTARIWDTD